MKLLASLLLCFLFFYSCKYKEIELYQKKSVTEVDTLNIERVKIPTH